jgi:cbb3-type cytochrome oxidase subunit 1
MMEWFVRAFLKSSLAWLAIGVTLGVATAAHPAWSIYRPAHVHLVLLGFVTMMIYGVAYHVIPRFSGYPLPSRKAARWHWWASNTGLLLMVGGFVLRPHAGGAATPLLVAGGAASAIGAYTFAWLIWRTIDGPVRMRRAAARVHASTGTPLPVMAAGAAGAPRA